MQLEPFYSTVMYYKYNRLNASPVLAKNWQKNYKTCKTSVLKNYKKLEKVEKLLKKLMKSKS